jgi:hypothetical protein
LTRKLYFKEQNSLLPFHGVMFKVMSAAIDHSVTTSVLTKSPLCIFFNRGYPYLSWDPVKPPSSFLSAPERHYTSSPPPTRELPVNYAREKGKAERLCGGKPKQERKYATFPTTHNKA